MAGPETVVDAPPAVSRDKVATQAATALMVLQINPNQPAPVVIRELSITRLFGSMRIHGELCLRKNANVRLQK